MMNYSLVLESLGNPALLFFVLGIVAVLVKSDLEIPANSSKFISLYLLFSIGFRGGQELAHESIDREIIWSMVLGISLSILIPLYTFFLIRKRLGNFNAGAICAAYGSVSAVTFVTGTTFLESHQHHFDGHMVAVMAIMEAPAIVTGLILVSLFTEKKEPAIKKRHALQHSFTNGSVMMIVGSLLIGYFADAKQAEGIRPFTTDIFKGFLAIFLLDMGIESGRKLKDFFSFGIFPLVFAIVIPLVNGSVAAVVSASVTADPGNCFMFAVLAASASYIAVPAAMKIALPQANPGLYLPMALAVTFPVNILIGFPLYYALVMP